MGADDPDQTRVAIVDPLVGAVIDRRYRIEFRLAAGGFGAIYRATHVISGRAIALKVLHASLAHEPDVVARFRREAEALGQLRSPHTVTAFDFGQTRDGTLYIAMELLQGESLYERFTALGPLPWRRLVHVMRQVCSSLAEAHALGIIHRDLKPTNIHLEEVSGDRDHVKVLDFGIAKILQGSSLEQEDLTRSGHMVGTFDYMAPEQMVGAQTSGQSDIYTLGIVMFEMLTGERPFGDPATPAAMLTAMLQHTPPPVSTYCDAPPALDAIVARCLERETDRRYRDVVELSDDLDRALAEAISDVTSLEVVPALEEASTQVRDVVVPPGLEDMMSDVDDGDGVTWVDGTPQPPSLTPTAGGPLIHPLTTLPGVAPPDRNTPWPLAPPKKPAK